MMDSANNASDNGFLLIKFLESITVAQLDLLRIDLPSRIKIVMFSNSIGLSHDTHILRFEPVYSSIYEQIGEQSNLEYFYIMLTRFSWIQLVGYSENYSIAGFAVTVMGILDSLYWFRIICVS